jgi:hypothetical protein
MEDRAKYSEIKNRAKLDPSTHWTIPFVTGHKYKISYGSVGLDFEKMSI